MPLPPQTYHSSIIVITNEKITLTNKEPKSRIMVSFTLIKQLDLNLH